MSAHIRIAISLVISMDTAQWFPLQNLSENLLSDTNTKHVINLFIYNTTVNILFSVV